jgi:hypothetical protein
MRSSHGAGPASYHGDLAFRAAERSSRSALSIDTVVSEFLGPVTEFRASVTGSSAVTEVTIGAGP